MFRCDFRLTAAQMDVGRMVAMKTIRAITALATTTMLQGCFMVIVPIPGPVVGAISDTVTGQFGAWCINRTYQPGAHIRTPDGALGTVKAISGPSSRCPDPEKPIRAEIAADE